MAVYRKIGSELLEDDIAKKIKNAAQINEITIDMLDPELRGYIESVHVDDGFNPEPIYRSINTLTKTKADISLLDDYFKKDTDKVTSAMLDSSAISAITKSASTTISKQFNSTYRKLQDDITMDDLGDDVLAQFDTIKQSIATVSSNSVSQDQLNEVSKKVTNINNTLAKVSSTASNAQTMAQNVMDSQEAMSDSIDTVAARLSSLEKKAMIKNSTVITEAQLPAATKKQLQTMANQISELQNPATGVTDKTVSATLTAVATNDLQMADIKADNDIESFYYINTEKNTVDYYTKVLANSDADDSTEKVYSWNSETLTSTTRLGFLLDKKYGRIFYNTYLVGGYPYVLSFDITLKSNASKTVKTTQWFSDCLSNRPLTYIKPDTTKEEYIPATLYITTLISANGFTVTNNTDETVSIKVIVKGVCR